MGQCLKLFAWLIGLAVSYGSDSAIPLLQSPLTGVLESIVCARALVWLFSPAEDAVELFARNHRGRAPAAESIFPAFQCLVKSVKDAEIILRFGIRV